MKEKFYWYDTGKEVVMKEYQTGAPIERACCRTGSFHEGLFSRFGARGHICEIVSSRDTSWTCILATSVVVSR